MQSITIPLTPLVQQLIENIGVDNLEDRLNKELTILLKNRIFGRQYFTLRLTRNMQSKVSHIQDLTGISFTSVILKAINDSYAEECS